MADLTKFTLSGSEGGEVFIWCPEHRHLEVVETLAEAIEWAENHSDG